MGKKPQDSCKRALTFLKDLADIFFVPGAKDLPDISFRLGAEDLADIFVVPEMSFKACVGHAASDLGNGMSRQFCR